MVLCLSAAYALIRPGAPPPIPVTPTQPPAIPTPPTPPALDAKSTLILELFNPSDEALTQQLSETALTQRIEHMLTTSFVLVRCGIIDEDAYRDTFYALILYAGKSKLAPTPAAAEARVRSIAESASTSYRFVYGHTPCDAPKLPLIAQQLKTWREAYLPKR